MEIINILMCKYHLLEHSIPFFSVAYLGTAMIFLTALLRYN